MKIPYDYYSLRGLLWENMFKLAERCFESGIPAIVSVHSINFHSSLEDFRGPTLRVLDEFSPHSRARPSATRRRLRTKGLVSVSPSQESQGARA